MSLAIVVIPRQVTSRVALSDLIEQGVTKGMGCEKPGKLIPLNGVPNLLWSWNRQKYIKNFRELAMVIIFKEIIEFSLENCLNWATLIRKCGDHCYEFLEASWASEGMWWGNGTSVLQIVKTRRGYLP